MGRILCKILRNCPELPDDTKAMPAPQGRGPTANLRQQNETSRAPVQPMESKRKDRDVDTKAKDKPGIWQRITAKHKERREQAAQRQTRIGGSRRRRKSRMGGMGGGGSLGLGTNPDYGFLSGGHDPHKYDAITGGSMSERRGRATRAINRRDMDFVTGGASLGNISMITGGRSYGRRKYGMLTQSQGGGHANLDALIGPQGGGHANLDALIGPQGGRKGRKRNKPREPDYRALLG